MTINTKSAGKPDNKKKNRQDDLAHLAKAIIANAGVGIYIVQFGKFVYVSELYQKITGYADTELIGTFSLGNIHPDDREMVRKRAIKCLKRESFEPYEYRFVKKNDEVMWALETITPVTYKEERATLGSFMDITERKQAEEALRQSEEKYRNILETIQEGYFEVDLNGNFTFCNNSMSRLTGHSKEELLGMNHKQFTNEETAKEVFQAFDNVYTTGEPSKGFDWQIIRKDGGEGFVEASVTLQKDLSGKPTGFKGMIRDITERKLYVDKFIASPTHGR